MKKRLIFVWTAILVVLLISGGCGKKKDVTLSPNDMGSDKEIYEKARKRIKSNPRTIFLSKNLFCAWDCPLSTSH